MTRQQERSIARLAPQASIPLPKKITTDFQPNRCRGTAHELNEPVAHYSDAALRM
jgi:hypothetical protein